MRAVLVGNQNCGKSTLFNILTGSNQKIGNWPGVTVSKKTGIIKDMEIELIDLPGIYSLYPYSLEEKITYGFLMNEEYDLIINIVDSTCIERGLFLTTELLELGKKVIVVLNMVDKLKEKGIEIKIDRLKENLKIDICLVSASRGSGIIDLLKTIKTNINNNLRINKDILNRFSKENEIVLRYKKVDNICKSCIRHIKKRKEVNEFIDKIVLNKILAIPIFFTIMFGMYYISIEIFGQIFADSLEKIIIDSKAFIEVTLKQINVYDWIISLLCDGVITGVGSVLSFLPQLTVVFLVTSFLEICGYMARVSFIFDKLLKKIGLSGKSLIPFILGTGCSASGIISTKIVENEEDRITSVITVPFIPCSAKLPIITLFTKYFFKNNYALIAISFYVLSIIIVICSAIIINKIILKRKEELYVFELPEYKFPKIKFLYKDVKQKILEFFNKAGTTIFIASLVIWFLLSFSTNFEYGVDIQNSILACLGRKISWIFEPIIGVKSWQASVSAIQGIIAKEQVISSMEIISGLSNNHIDTYKIFDEIGSFNFFNKASAYSFVAFNLFTAPCIVAISAMAKEIKNLKIFILSVVYQLVLGWGLSVILYNILSRQIF